MLTKEQADRVKEIIDGDANLASAYLKVKDINYIDFANDWEEKNPLPEDIYEYRAVNNWHLKKQEDWEEYINSKLLPENVLGACVIGGLAISLIAKYPERNLLRELYNFNARGIQNVNLHEVSVLLEEEFGLTMNMQRELQYTNDNEVHTLKRRENLKKLIDSWTEPSEEAES